MSSCREYSPGLCHSSQTSSCLRRNPGPNQRYHLRWWTLMERKRGWRTRFYPKNSIWVRSERRVQTYLVVQCHWSLEEWTGCGGGKLWPSCLFDRQLVRIEREEEEKETVSCELTCCCCRCWWSVWAPVLGFTWKNVGRIRGWIRTHCAAKREKGYYWQ